MHVATITIDHLKVAGDLTDFVVAVVNNSDAGWAELYALATEGGGDIRVYKAGGVTELPREILSFSVSSETGEIYIKYSGTLSSSVDTDIEIHADGTSSDYAVGATYGRNNVWTGFKFVYHVNGAGTVVDATGDQTPTQSGTITAASTAPFGTGAGTAGSNLYINSNYNPDTDIGLGDFSVQVWFKTAQQDRRRNYIGLGGNGTSFQYIANLQMGHLSSDNYRFYFQGRPTTTGYWQVFAGSTNYQDNTWHMAHATRAGTTAKIFVDGTQQGTLTAADVATNLGTGAYVSGFPWDTTNFEIADDFAEVRVAGIDLGANWIDTDHENQGNMSTFYSVAAIAPGITVTPAVQTATSSLQAPTVTAVRNVTITPAVLTATSSAQTSTPSGDAVVSTTPLTATATAPIVVIDAGGNITIAVSALTATASVQAPTVAVVSNISVSPTVLSATGSVQAPSVAVGTGATIAQAVQVITAAPQSPTVVSEQSRIITPAVMAATASLIAPIKTGPLWTPVGRAGDADEWTAVERVT